MVAIIRFADRRECEQRTHSTIAGDARSPRRAAQFGAETLRWKLWKSGISAPVLKPKQRAHDEAMGEHHDGLVAAPPVQSMFEPAYPPDEIRKTLAAKGVGPMPIACFPVGIAAGMTQEGLARRLGVKPQQVQRYEATEYESASFARIRKVVQALGLSMPKAVRLVRNG